MRTRRFGGWAAWLGVAALGLGWPAWAGAQGLPPSRERDVRLTFQVRRALAADPALQALNLSVQVRGGVATLWGPVPSAEAGRRALGRAAALPGVVDVQSEMFVSGTGTPGELLAGLPTLPEPPPQRTEVASPDRDSGLLNLLTRRPGARPRREADGPGEGLPPVAPPRPLEAAPATPTAEAPRPVAAPVLLAPVPLDEPPAPRVDRRLRARPVRRVTTASLSVPLAVEQVRQAEVRFELMRVEVRGGQVVVRAGEARGEDAMALADALRRVPGVTEVLVDE